MENVELINKLFTHYMTATGVFAPALYKLIEDPQDQEQLRQSQEGLIQSLSEAVDLGQGTDVSAFNAAAQTVRSHLNTINQILAKHEHVSA
jgi:hypothetical protein